MYETKQNNCITDVTNNSDRATGVHKCFSYIIIDGLLLFYALLIRKVYSSAEYVAISYLFVAIKCITTPQI